MDQNHKNKGLLETLLSIVDKGRKIPENIKRLSEDITLLSKTLTSLILTVNEHSTAITDLYNAQLIILQHLKTEGIDAKPKIEDVKAKDKINKPN